MPSLAARLLVPLLLLLALPLQAQTVRVVPLADTVSIGERFEVAIVARHHMMQEARFPSPARGDTLLGDLVLLARRDSQRRYLGQQEPGITIDSVVYEATTFALDTALVAPAAVQLASGGETVQALSPLVLLPVRSTVPDSAAGLQPLRPLADFPAPLWPYALLALAALALLGLLVYLWRARQEEGEVPLPAAPAPEEPPYREARRRLAALAAQLDTDGEALADADVKPFYVEVSDLLRAYLERRLRVPALERTTDELRRELSLRSASKTPEQATEPLLTALRRADLVKFADIRPAPPAHRDVLADARAALDAFEHAAERRELSVEG